MFNASRLAKLAHIYDRWWQNGGIATLLSYGGKALDVVINGKWEEALQLPKQKRKKL